jgi:large subunit ribosomal protein L16
MFEIGGVPEEKAKLAFKRVAHKMPVKVKLVRRIPVA